MFFAFLRKMVNIWLVHTSFPTVHGFPLPPAPHLQQFGSTLPHLSHLYKCPLHQQFLQFTVLQYQQQTSNSIHTISEKIFEPGNAVLDNIFIIFSRAQQSVNFILLLNQELFRKNYQDYLAVLFRETDLVESAHSNIDLEVKL